MTNKSKEELRGIIIEASKTSLLLKDGIDQMGHIGYYGALHLANAILSAGYIRKEDVELDTIFIKHIQSHLSEGQEVICKICGKTAKEITDEI